jgi:hypothetical protein
LDRWLVARRCIPVISLIRVGPPDRRKLAAPTLFRKKLYGGVSLADTSDNQGRLGNGNKHGIAVCLRNSIANFAGTAIAAMFYSIRPDRMSS